MIRSGRNTQTADRAPTDLLSALSLQLLVQVHAVLAHAHKRGGSMEDGDYARGVPGRTAREFALVNEDDVVPAIDIRQMIGKTASRDPAADNDNSRRLFH